MIKFVTVFTIAVIAIMSFFTFKLNETKVATGWVSDCQTNLAVDNAEVSLIQRNWGFADNGQLIWDKDYIYKGLTDENGSFRIQYKGSPNHIQSKKPGYYRYDKYQPLSENLQLKMLQGDIAGDATYDCKFYSEHKN